MWAGTRQKASGVCAIIPDNQDNPCAKKQTSLVHACHDTSVEYMFAGPLIGSAPRRALFLDGCHSKMQEPALACFSIRLPRHMPSLALHEYRARAVAGGTSGRVSRNVGRSSGGRRPDGPP